MASKTITPRSLRGAAEEISKLTSNTSKAYVADTRKREQLGRAAVNANPATFKAPAGSRRVPGLSTGKRK